MLQSTKFVILCVIICLVIILSIIVLTLSIFGYNKLKEDKNPVLDDSTITTMTVVNGIALAICIFGVVILIWQVNNVMKQEKQGLVQLSANNEKLKETEMKIKTIQTMIHANTDPEILKEKFDALPEINSNFTDKYIIDDFDDISSIKNKPSKQRSMRKANSPMFISDFQEFQPLDEFQDLSLDDFQDLSLDEFQDLQGHEQFQQLDEFQDLLLGKTKKMWDSYELDDMTYGRIQEFIGDVKYDGYDKYNEPDDFIQSPPINKNVKTNKNQVFDSPNLTMKKSKRRKNRNRKEVDQEIEEIEEKE